MSKPRKIILILFAAVVALFLVVLIGRNVIITLSVPSAVRSLTGFDAEVGHVNAGVFSSQITIRNLKVTNPADFHERRMLHAPEIFVDYRLPSMLSSRREFVEIRLNIAEVVVVTNEKGESNVARIMAVNPKSGSGHGESSTENHYGKLDLTLGKVTMIDYSKMVQGKPLTKETTLNFHGTYHNLTDSDLKRVVMLETLKYLPGRLRDITPDSIEKQLGGVISGTMFAGTNITDAAMEAVKGLGGFLKPKTNTTSKTK